MVTLNFVGGTPWMLVRVNRKAESEVMYRPLGGVLLVQGTSLYPPHIMLEVPLGSKEDGLNIFATISQNFATLQHAE